MYSLHFFLVNLIQILVVFRISFLLSTIFNSVMNLTFESTTFTSLIDVVHIEKPYDQTTCMNQTIVVID